MFQIGDEVEIVARPGALLNGKRGVITAYAQEADGDSYTVRMHDTGFEIPFVSEYLRPMQPVAPTKRVDRDSLTPSLLEEAIRKERERCLVIVRDEATLLLNSEAKSCCLEVVRRIENKIDEEHLAS